MRKINNFPQFINEYKVSYKKELYQNIWNGDTLIPRIREKLLKIARDFYDGLELDTEIVDIVIVGSMANYNYTSTSDIDVHILIDFSEINEDTTLVKKALDGQRFIWNLRHNIVIQKHDVELYMQDKNEENISAGTYSLLKGEWIKKPVYNPPDVDTSDFEPKYEAYVYDITELDKLSKTDLSEEDATLYFNRAKKLKDKIRDGRKSGLAEGGEFNVENLVFKKLRSEGKIGILIDTINRFYDMIYSQ
jgi:predicted nucleotidyltransferase